MKGTCLLCAGPGGIPWREGERQRPSESKVKSLSWKKENILATG